MFQELKKLLPTTKQFRILYGASTSETDVKNLSTLKMRIGAN